jgi:drug/metabolite transporter (DMT)-like permease
MTGMDPYVFGAVLAAAAMHAGWNSILKIGLEPFLAMTLVTASAGVASIPLLVVFGWPAAPAWPWLIASIILHLAYYVVLTEAYRRADIGQVYPIARGGAPLLTALASPLVIAEPVGLPAMAGIAVLGCGIAMMSIFGRRRGAALDPLAIVFALLTAIVICGYTFVDGIGARTAGDPHAYSAALFALDALPLLCVALWQRGLGGLAPMKRFLGPGFLGGAMSLGSYWIAIWAMTLAPIALVAAVRETSVLFATLIAFAVLKEPMSPGRIMAAVMIMGGLLITRAG